MVLSLTMVQGAKTLQGAVTFPCPYFAQKQYTPAESKPFLQPWRVESASLSQACARPRVHQSVRLRVHLCVRACANLVVQVSTLKDL